MRINNVLSLILFCLFPSSFIRGQNATQCVEFVHQSNVAYDAKNYEEALLWFGKATECPNELSNNDYYNGACIASLLQKEQLTIDFLKIAILKGWENIEHMNKDTDLDFIREKPSYLALLKQIVEKYDYLNQHFVHLDSIPLDSFIPFAVGTKWGWLHKQSKKVLVKPVFDFTDFKCAKGLMFQTEKQIFLFNEQAKVVKSQMDLNEPNITFGSDKPKIIADDTIKGFTIRGNEIRSYSSQYRSVQLVEGLHWGIAMRQKDSLVGMIRENGDIITGFNFKFDQIQAFEHQGNSFFICKRPKQTDYELYDEKGKKILKQSIDGFNSGYSIKQPTPTHHWLFVGYQGYQYLQINIKNNYNVFDKSTRQLLFPKNYNHIVMLNGPSNDADRSGSYRYGMSPPNGILEPYFLIKEGNDSFYVDGQGVEYKPQ